MINIVQLNLNQFEKETPINSLFIFTNVILHMIKYKKKILILDDIDKYKSNLIDLLNIEKTNHFLNEKYNIFIFFKSTINFDLWNVRYGFPDNNIDLTNYIYIHFYKLNILCIPKHTNINEMLGDPAPYKKKFFFVKYYLNKHLFEDIYLEESSFLSDKIYYDFKNMSYYENDNVENNFENNFENIPTVLPNIVLNDRLYSFTENFFTKYFIKEDKINIIYIDLLIKNYNKKNDNSFKIAYDMIDFAQVSEEIEQLKEDTDTIDITEENIEIHEVVINVIDDILENIIVSIEKEDWKNTLERNYINTIEKHVNINEKNIIISETHNNNVIEYLKKNNYNLYFMKPEFKETNCINDLNDFLVTRFCNNKFIGRLEENNDYYYMRQRHLLGKDVIQILIAPTKKNETNFL